jgi:hypothetical protein
MVATDSVVVAEPDVGVDQVLTNNTARQRHMKYDFVSVTEGDVAATDVLADQNGACGFRGIRP